MPQMLENSAHSGFPFSESTQIQAEVLVRGQLSCLKCVALFVFRALSRKAATAGRRSRTTPKAGKATLEIMLLLISAHAGNRSLIAPPECQEFKEEKSSKKYQPGSF